MDVSKGASMHLVEQITLDSARPRVLRVSNPLRPSRFRSVLAPGRVVFGGRGLGDPPYLAPISIRLRGRVDPPLGPEPVRLCRSPPPSPFTLQYSFSPLPRRLFSLGAHRTHVAGRRPLSWRTVFCKRLRLLEASLTTQQSLGLLSLVLKTHVVSVRLLAHALTIRAPVQLLSTSLTIAATSVLVVSARDNISIHSSIVCAHAHNPFGIQQACPRTHFLLEHSVFARKTRFSIIKCVLRCCPYNRSAMNWL